MTMQIAKDFMVANLVTLDPATPVLQGIQKLVHSNIKGAPVVSRRRDYLGIFTERCCLKVLTTLTDRSTSLEVAGSFLMRSRDFMTRQLSVLRPDMDAFDAVNFLLSRRISGAPVVDNHGRFLGVFSERQGMSVLVGAIYDNLPGAQVSSYMVADRGRIISEDLGIGEVARLFLSTTYRRLVVERDGRVIGQISRHDVMVNAQVLVRALINNNAASGPSWTVSEFMDRDAMTIDESLNIFSIATIFRETSQRRLPVIRGNLLVGQITRKNLLNAANDTLRQPPARAVEPLYLPGVPHASPPPM